MAAASSRHPWVWAVLYFPFGLTIGLPSIALGYLASRAGIAVSAIAAVVGMTFLASGWKFVWAPLGDHTLSRKRWYRIAISLVSVGFIALTLVPITARTMPLLSVLVLVTSIAGTFIAFATEGLMTHNTSAATRGRAGGWFQSGNQFGQTAGGGIALWWMRHMPSPWMAGVALAAILWTCSLALRGLEEPPRALDGASVGQRVADAWRELAAIVQARAGRIGVILAILPIGTGAAQALFASIVPSPRTGFGYTASTLLYTFTLGMAAATLAALILAIIGDTAAATKINLFFALNTLFSLGMLRVTGWAHDRWATTGMLYTEAAVGAAALVLFLVFARRVRGRELGAAA